MIRDAYFALLHGGFSSDGAIATVLVLWLTPPELAELSRIVREMMAEGLRGFTPAELFCLAQAARFNLEEG
jgi:hypothetical protein